MFSKFGFIATAIAALAIVSPAASAPPPSVLLPPQAAAQAANEGHVSAPGQVRKASVAEVRAAASVPGTVTEGTLDTVRSFQSVRRHAETEANCFYARPGDTWGTWPYQQSVYQSTYWCARGGLLTYRSTSMESESSICARTDSDQQKVGGGVGYDYVVVHGWVSFSCTTIIPWAPTNTFRWANWLYHAMGLYWETAVG
jgi:hypothetical protein